MPEPRSFELSYPDSDEGYRRYERAATAAIGPVAPGQYGIVGSTFVKRLDSFEFSERYEEFLSLDRLYRSFVASGATIDDELYRELSRIAGELFLQEVAGRFVWP